MKNERHVLFSPQMPFGVVLSLEYMHFLNIQLISLCLFLLLSSGKQSQWILSVLKKKLYV